MLDIMNALVATIKTASVLHYLQWVGVLDHEDVPPEEPLFPFVGIVDNGLTDTSQPNKKDLEVFSVKVVAYQSLPTPEPGGHLLGDTSLPNGQGTGLLQITQDLKTLLHDNKLGIPEIYWAHRDRVDPSQLVLDPETPDSRFVMMMQKSIFTYRRFA